MVRRRVLDYGLAGILLLIPVAILHSGLKDPKEVNGFDKAVLRISSPLQAAVSWVIDGVGGWVNGYVWLVDVEEENRELRSENERLRRELAHARRDVADTDALEDLVELREDTAADAVGARVVAASLSPYFRIMRITVDRGEGDVETDMPVVTADGLVGRIHNVYGSYSDVLLVSDPTSKVEVEVVRTGGLGMVRGIGRDGSYACTVDWLDRAKDVKVGDELVTSGLGNFPAGIPVGTVTAVTTKEYGMYQEVEVEPIVDLADVRAVMVLLAPPPPPDPDPSPEESETAAGVEPY